MRAAGPGQRKGGSHCPNSGPPGGQLVWPPGALREVAGPWDVPARTRPVATPCPVPTAIAARSPPWACNRKRDTPRA
eukprot:7261514-Heterocapsa_arctica.AAC.1